MKSSLSFPMRLCHYETLARAKLFQWITQCWFCPPWKRPILFPQGIHSSKKKNNNLEEVGTQCNSPSHVSLGHRLADPRLIRFNSFLVQKAKWKEDALCYSWKTTRKTTWMTTGYHPLLPVEIMQTSTHVWCFYSVWISSQMCMNLFPAVYGCLGMISSSIIDFST